MAVPSYEMHFINPGHGGHLGSESHWLRAYKDLDL